MSTPAEGTPKAVPSSSAAEPSPDKDKSSSGSGGGDEGAGALEVANKDKSTDEYIRLRVITSDMTNEVHFRVKSATALGRLKRSYCSKLGFQADELRFVFDGHRITDDDTPNSLGMINDDVIEIYQERTGGMCST